MTQKSDTPWKAIAVVLALILGAVLIFAALVVSGVMKLGVPSGMWLELRVA